MFVSYRADNVVIFQSDEHARDRRRLRMKACRVPAERTDGGERWAEMPPWSNHFFQPFAKGLKTGHVDLVDVDGAVGYHVTEDFAPVSHVGQSARG